MPQGKVKTIQDRVNEEKENIRSFGFMRIMKDLRAAEIKAVIEGNGITGVHKSEPFVIYFKWLVSNQGKVCGVVATRYKGKDVEMIPPVTVLTK